MRWLDPREAAVMVHVRQGAPNVVLPGELSDAVHALVARKLLAVCYINREGREYNVGVKATPMHHLIASALRTMNTDRSSLVGTGGG